MQILWAKILAGEANQPGSYSRKTVNILNDLEKLDALLFQTLCRFSVHLKDPVPLVFDFDAPIYRDLKINYENLIHLQSLGLIHVTSPASDNRLEIQNQGEFSVTYGDDVFVIQMKGGDSLPLGKALFTEAGKQLYYISKADTVENFYDYVKTQWSHYLD